MFSKACEHGIKAMIYIATRSAKNGRVKLGDVASNADSPEAFTAKVLGKLSRANLLRSFKGPLGGFELTVSQAKSISIKQVVMAIDGERLFVGCALGLNECDAAKPCPMHHKFIKIRDGLNEVLESTSVFDLASGISSGVSFLTR